LRALLASHVLLPLMKAAGKETNPAKFKVVLDGWKDTIEAIANQPELLSSCTIKAKDSAVQPLLESMLPQLQITAATPSTVTEDERDKAEAPDADAEEEQILGEEEEPAAIIAIPKTATAATTT